MIIIIETVILCIAFFLICFWGTGTDNKNLKSYSSYPDEVQNRIKSIAEYQGKFKESNNVVTFVSNFLLFLFVLFILGLFIKENGFTHNFLCLSIIGQGLNIFDLFIVDLLWWRNTKRVRLRKMPEKELYQNPKKHIEAFIRAFIMYLLIALIDGYILTLMTRYMISFVFAGILRWPFIGFALIHLSTWIPEIDGLYLMLRICQANLL